MSKRVQLRRGTATEHNTFTGAVGEVTVDTTNKTIRVHDGSTVGGTVLAKASQIPTAATYTNAGIIQLATEAEVQAAANNTKAITPNNLLVGMLRHLNADGGAGIFACRAWVNFNAVPLSGTYTQTGTTVTVTMTNHGMTVGQQVNLTVTTGLAPQGDRVVTSVPNANTFTYESPNTATTSGNVTRNTFIKASGNVLGILDNGVGDFTITFAGYMQDANYAVVFGASDQANGTVTPKVLTPSGTNTAPLLKTTSGVRVGHNPALDTSDFSVAIFR